MRKMIVTILLFSSVVYAKGVTTANKETKSAKQEVEHAHVKGEEHDDEESGDHGDHKDSGDHEEENSKIGPDKGILESHEESGFKLSPEALKNFEIKTQKLSSQGPWELPLSARLLSQEEINLFRVREGFFKRIDFSLLSKTQSVMKITSSELKEGDEVVVNGIGFLRIAEITAFGGAPEGHSH